MEKKKWRKGLAACRNSLWVKPYSTSKDTFHFFSAFDINWLFKEKYIFWAGTSIIDARAKGLELFSSDNLRYYTPRLLFALLPVLPMHYPSANGITHSCNCFENITQLSWLFHWLDSMLQGLIAIWQYAKLSLGLFANRRTKILSPQPYLHYSDHTHITNLNASWRT